MNSYHCWSYSCFPKLRWLTRVLFYFIFFVYRKCANLIFFCINILSTDKNPNMRPLLLQITVREVKGNETGRPCTNRGPGNELETCVTGN